MWPDLAKFWQFGKFLKSLAIFEALFTIWKVFEPTYFKKNCIGTNFHCCKWPNIEQIMWPSGHTVNETVYWGYLCPFLIRTDVQEFHHSRWCLPELFEKKELGGTSCFENIINKSPSIPIGTINVSLTAKRLANPLQNPSNHYLLGLSLSWEAASLHFTRHTSEVAPRVPRYYVLSTNSDGTLPTCSFYLLLALLAL